MSLQAEDIPLATAVRLLSEMAGLKPVRVGDTLFVTTKKTAAEMRGDPDLMGPRQGPAQPTDADISLFGSGSVRSFSFGSALPAGDW